MLRHSRLVIHVLALLTLEPAAISRAAEPRRKVIIDQDAFGPGGSNMQALLLTIQSPDVEVIGITIESGDGWRDENAAHTLRLLEIIGRADIPVLAGATFPLVNTPEETKRWEALHGKLAYKGAWTEAWPKGVPVKRTPYHGPFIVPPLEEGAPATRVADENAPAFMIRKVREFPGEITVLALGPFTNLALAIRLDDTFAATAKELVFMGGSFSPHPADNAFALEYLYTPRLEFNVRWDPEAARIMLHAPWKKIVQVPVDPTTKTMFTPGLIRRSSAASTPLCAYLAKYAEGFPMWDELAVAVWLKPGLVTTREILAVDADIDHGAGYGNTLSWPAGHGPGLGERDVEVVFDIDVRAFEDFCVDLFVRPRP